MSIADAPQDDTTSAANPAADLIRSKLSQLYNAEPNAREELQEAEGLTHRSKHQQFMYSLSRSGRSLAEIQTAWHKYYIDLPDNEKHQVWQEFYDEYNRRRARHSSPKPPTETAKQKVKPKLTKIKEAAQRTIPNDLRSVSDIKRQLLGHINKQTRRKGDHLKSLLFGLSAGLVVMAILLFGFFNERFIAPFITPSRSVSNTPIIIDPTNTAVGPEPKLIIPKINVEIPVVYDEPSVAEPAVEKALERGVVHYATTPSPGELGNGVIFGHSANNILNKGKYKYAFVLLKRLEVGDTFMVQKDGKRFVYQVFSKKIVKPNDVSVLNDGQGKPATFTLITCDPPGTSLNRLVVTAQQITPDPTANVASTAKPSQTQPKILPSNAPTLWSRFWSWITG